MSRDVQSDDVKSKVLASARKLFIEKGYAQTTIREMSIISGVSSGSIYHFFADKEGVFLHLTLDVFESTLQAATERAARHRDPYLSLSLKWAFLMRLISADKRVAELFSVAYSSQKISERLLKVSTQRHQQLLGDVLGDWDSEQFFIATLLLGGVLSALVSEKVNIDSLSEEKRIRALLSTVLPAFGVEPDKARELIQKSMKFVPTIALDAAGLGAG